VSNPQTYLEECWRVLRPGGKLLLSTHGMMVYHPDPVDYWRWTGAGLIRAVEQAGFVVQHREGIMGLGSVGLQMVQDSIYFRIPGRLRPFVALVFQSLVAGADTLSSDASRDNNALVFAVIAEKPVVAGQPATEAGS
jgi:SAM-dependent methyltransferase